MATVVWARSLGPLVVAELRHRYAESALGALWAVLVPLVEVAAYAIVFGLLLGPGRSPDGLTFAFFVASGLLPWSALREALEGSAVALSDNRWIRRSRVPVELLVARLTIASAVRAGAGLVIVVLFAFARGTAPGPAAVLLPALALALQIVACFGLGLILAPLTVLQPDLRPGLASALTLLTFASPILYPERLLPAPLVALLEWNPFTHFLRFYRLPLALPDSTLGLSDLWVVLGTSLVLLVAGLIVKSRLFWAARDRL